MVGVSFIVGILVIVVGIIYFCYWYWEHVYFFRDPDRKAPKGKNILSAADGRVVYVKKVKNDVVPIAVKRRKKIKLKEILETDSFKGDKYLVGVFMTPFDVHVQRAPISGTVKKIAHYQHENKVMTITWIRCLLNLMPLYNGASYLIENERKTVLFDGDIPVYVTQIADLVVDRIKLWIFKGQEVGKGQRYGMIEMGSQVDMVFPCEKNVKVVVKPGQKVKAGETIIAKY